MSSCFGQEEICRLLSSYGVEIGDSGTIRIWYKMKSFSSSRNIKAVPLDTERTAPA